MYSFTQRNLRSIALLIFRQFRLSLKCSQSRRLNNYTFCSTGNCGGNYPISNTTVSEANGLTEIGKILTGTVIVNQRFEFHLNI